MLSSSDFGRNLVKWFNAANVVLQQLNDKLFAIAQNGVSLDVLLGNATQLRDYLDNAINLPPRSIAALLQYVQSVPVNAPSPPSPLNKR